MATIAATYFDGRSSTPLAVRATLRADALVVEADDWRRIVPLAEVAMERPIGGRVWIGLLADGAQLHAREPGELERLSPRSWASRVRFPASPPVSRAMAAALAAVMLAIAAILAGEVHSASALVARTLPESIEARIGADALAQLDHDDCAPSQLPAQRRNAVQRTWRTLTHGMARAAAYRLEFRDCPAIGENALALGGGIAVVTDGLVRALPDDREMAAVLAHELGHLRRRHALREVIERGVRDATLASVLGAMPNGSGLLQWAATSTPRELIADGYSRDFEREADAFAFERLKAVGISPRYFATALERLVRDSEGADGAAPAGLDRYFDTHPLDSERIAAALAAGGKRQ